MEPSYRMLEDECHDDVIPKLTLACSIYVQILVFLVRLFRIQYDFASDEHSRLLWLWRNCLVVCE